MLKSFAVTLGACLLIGFVFFIARWHSEQPYSNPSFNPTRADDFDFPLPTPETTPTLSPTPSPTPIPTPVPTPSPWEIFNPYATELTNPENVRNFRFESRIEGELGPIHFGMPETYTRHGITTFRGNNFRNTATVGTVNVTEERLVERYRFGVGNHGQWTGVGWTGQPSIVRWDFDVQQMMNIHDTHRNNPDLIEVIQGALDGNVYFFCLQSGEQTRPPIRIGVPIKGAITVHPAGLPLLFVGQGDVAGSRFGYYIFSLIDGSEIFFLNGNEAIAPRRWGAFDSNPLFDIVNDRMILCGENGVVYNFLLNTHFDREAQTISIDPVISRYWFNTGRRLGIENSPVALGNYLFFGDNSGYITCLDLLTFEPVWLFDARDDHDSSLAAEWCDETENLYLYSATQVDLQGHGGSAFIRRIDASNGTVLWEHAYRCHFNERSNGGVTSSPLLGEHDISHIVVYWVAQVMGRGGSGALVAFNRVTGEIVWENIFPSWGWSSPVAVYTPDGTSYLIVSDIAGNMRLIRGTTGEVIYTLNLGANIEASAAIFENMLVVGTRGQRVYGIEII
jgi:outer membrane protein assembly factor BamB